ncbi:MULTISPECIES: Cro/CI family transcriptional regulator [Serratia]|uniref:Cro/CI family transcriptional regulator n=1 Tax=Serratia TaxID=613 RepID=UPI0021BDEEC8|nr:Cro/CI family transcriptional regulator [Serratia marcescens]
MHKEEAINFFGSKTKLAKAAGVSQASVSRWGDIIPERRAARLAELTNGALRYDMTLYGAEKQSSETD